MISRIDSSECVMKRFNNTTLIYRDSNSHTYTLSTFKNSEVLTDILEWNYYKINNAYYLLCTCKDLNSFSKEILYLYYITDNETEFILSVTYSKFIDFYIEILFDNRFKHNNSDSTKYFITRQRIILNYTNTENKVIKTSLIANNSKNVINIEEYDFKLITKEHSKNIVSINLGKKSQGLYVCYKIS